MNRPVLTAVSMGLVSLSLAAQTTWVVDAAGAPGSQFTGLPAAFAAVADGDTVIVRAGTYAPGTLSNAIRLIGEPGASVESPFGGPSLVVNSIAAGQRCTVRGLRVAPYPFLSTVPAVHVLNCAGTVVLHDLNVESHSSTPGLRVQNCSAVLLSGSLIRPSLAVEDSTLSAQNCSISAFASGAVAHGVTGFRAYIELSHCVVAGSDGPSNSGVGDGISAHQCDLVVRGDASSRVVGGTQFMGTTPTFFADAIDGHGTCTLLVDPAVTLVHAVVGVAMTTQAMPSLIADGGAAGATIDLDLRATPGDSYALAISLPGTAIPFAPFGVFWLDGLSTAPLGAGVMGPGGSFGVQIARSSNPNVLGLPLVAQGLSVGALAQLTNPAAVVVY